MKWMKVISREYGVQYTELSLRCLGDECRDLMPFPIYGQAYVPDNKNEVCFFHEENWNGLVKSLEKEYSSPKKLLAYKQRFLEFGAKYLEAAKAAGASAGTGAGDLSSLENSELAVRYRRYYTALLPYGNVIWTSFILNNLVAKKASNVLNSYLKGMANESTLLKIALSPTGKAAVLQLQEDAASGKNRDELYEKYKWMSCLDLHNAPWTREQFDEYLKTLKPAEAHKMSFEELVHELNLQGDDYDAIYLAKGFAYLKDVKDDFRRQGIFHALPFFAEIGARMGIFGSDTSYLLRSEILDFLEGNRKINQQAVLDRKNGFTIYYDGRKNIKCEHGRRALDIIGELGILLEEKKSDELLGTIASKGEAKGRVVIVCGVADLKKVRKGDILVAVTTHPDYVVAMQKAAAIVAEEGGVTCHAAIVSRELGIPCIVGVENATKALKNGDAVEVNANLGFVKKIQGA